MTVLASAVSHLNTNELRLFQTLQCKYTNYRRKLGVIHNGSADWMGTRSLQIFFVRKFYMV